MTRHSPLQIRMALAYYSSPKPELMFSKEAWGSEAATEAREWLFNNGLVDRLDFPCPTEKLSVFVKAICDVPLPVARWVVATPKEAK